MAVSSSSSGANLIHFWTGLTLKGTKIGSGISLYSDSSFNGSRRMSTTTAAMMAGTMAVVAVAMMAATVAVVAVAMMAAAVAGAEAAAITVCNGYYEGCFGERDI